ncbi:hypothetical protein SKAU_G00044760 [Synaphobranchus kaupii]|uniref:Uncharacterized protein n=1 Tax=Synaphobranchus kaupii TaxID=118154 RepID=A0A9Q1G2M7_SYNKA|nr:hypothetical protein SKAU_G00044760 [Synaphobranchus kaupii]
MTSLAVLGSDWLVAEGQLPSASSVEAAVRDRGGQTALGFLSLPACSCVCFPGPAGNASSFQASTSATVLYFTPVFAGLA